MDIILYTLLSLVIIVLLITLCISKKERKKSIIKEEDAVLDFDYSVNEIFAENPILKYYPKKNIIVCNESSKKLLKLSEGNMLSLDEFAEKISIRNSDLKEILDVGKTTYLNITIDNNILTYLFVISKSENRETTIILCDITAEKTFLQEEKEEIKTDNLTGFVSRYGFIETLNKMNSETINNKKLALFLLRIDHFNIIANKNGHTEGDKILKVFAEILKSFGLENKAYIRMSENRFVIIHNDINDESEAKTRANQWLNYFKNNFISTDKADYSITFSCGVVVSDFLSEELNNLYEYADFALYQIKQKGSGNIKIFSKEEYDKERNYNSYIEEMNRIIDEKDLYHVFLPVVVSETGNIAGYEALLRTKSPMFEDISTLFELASLHNRSSDLDKIALVKLIEDLNKQKKMLIEKRIFVNLQDEALLNEYNLLLKISNSDFKIVFEVGERLKDPNILTNIYKVLKKYNIEISLDDFGTGYLSELSLLSQQSSFNYVKIDMKLIREIQNDNNKKTLVKQLIKYAKETGAKIIAEGIETIEELDALMSIGVDFVQGFLFTKPTIYFDEINSEILTETVRLYKFYLDQNNNEI